MTQTIKRGTDKRGNKLALQDNGNGTFMVIVRRGNYSGRAPGGIAYSWSVVTPPRQPIGECGRMTREAAEALFARRAQVKG